MGRGIALPALIVLLCALAPEAAQNTITPQEFVEEHNAYRCELGLEPVEWDSELAAVARLWADNRQSNGCAMQHSTDEWRRSAFATAGYPTHAGASAWTGENLAWAWGSKSVPAKSGREVSGMWASEKQFYNMGGTSDSCTINTLNKQVGHYTQMVWHSTRKIGCAVAECESTTALWVCMYYPGGNLQGQLPFCKSNRPSDMGACSNLDLIADPAIC